MYLVSVPISVQVSKQKRFYLNLNQYRNAHHFTLSKAKIVFHDIVKKRLDHLPFMGKITLSYRLFVGTNQLIDTNNVCSIVDKFFSDTLVATGKIEDDNRHIVVGSEFLFGGIDKHDPRVEVTITPVTETPGTLTNNQPKENTMKISLVQNEIEDAIRDQVRSKIAVKDDQRIDVKLRATRGEEGWQADVDIVSQDAPAPLAKGSVKVAAKRKSTSTRKTATASAPKAEPEVMQTATEDAQGNSSPEVVPVADTVEEPVLAEALQPAEDDKAPVAEKRPSLFASAQPVENA